MPIPENAATSLRDLNAAALRLGWMLAPGSLKSKLRDALHPRWYKALASAPKAELSVEELSDYTPLRLNVGAGAPTVTWLKTGRLGATDPFFEQAVYRSWLSQLRPRLCRTSLDALFALHEAEPGLDPAGFVFHVGRCGSTLVANMLAAVESCLVLPEPFIVSVALILSETPLPPELRVKILRAVVGVLGRPRDAKQKHLFLKFTSWNVLYLDFIKKVYPEVPWMFLYRRPLEVAVSNLEDKIAWTMAKSEPGLIQRHLGIPDADGLGVEEFYARAIGRYGEAALNGLDDRAMLVNYREITESFIPRLLSYFKIDATAEEVRKMRGCLQFHSKDASRKRRHSDDSRKKTEMASPELRELVERHAEPSYEALERRHAEASAAPSPG